MIRDNPGIKGFSLQDFLVKIIVFADLKNLDSLTRVLETLSLYSCFSFLNINLEKSEIGWIGPQRSNMNTDEIPLAQKQLKWVIMKQVSRY